MPKLLFLIFIPILSSAAPAAKTSARLPSQQAPIKDGEVCFSPKGQCEKKIFALLDSATKSIDLAIYDLNIKGVIKRLIAKSKNNVQVRVIVDHRQAHTPRSKVIWLLNKKILVRYGQQSGIMHDKFLIIDGQYLATGSFNFTYGAARKNHENQLYFNNPELIAAYQAEFEDIWQFKKAANLFNPGEIADIRSSLAQIAAKPKRSSKSNEEVKVDNADPVCVDGDEVELDKVDP